MTPQTCLLPSFYTLVFYYCIVTLSTDKWFGGVTVRASDLRSSGRGFDS